ncbi:TPA: hypothetical protein ACF3XO_004474 [Vibrio parahaemolyticus]
MNAETQVVILALVVIVPAAIFWAFNKKPDDTQSDSVKMSKPRDKSPRKKREDFVSDYYLTGRIGKR